MSKHKKEKAKIKFVGLSSDDVTGSSHLITYKKENVLLECGFYQCKDKVKQYRVNSRNLGFKPRELTCVALMHNHLDHLGLIPRLYELGCTAPLYAPIGTYDYLTLSMEDSLKIQDSDIEFISNRIGKKAKPLFSRKSVEIMLSHIVEIDFDTEVEINPFMKIKFQHAYHILGSAQLELFIKDNCYKKKLYYSSDLGNIAIKNKPFVEPFVKVLNSDVAIVETTYAMNNNRADNKTRKNDIDKLRATIKNVNIDSKKGNTIIASFAMQRAQEILLLLYDEYGEDETFDTKILLDSPLSVKVTDHFIRNANEYDKERLKKAVAWKNVKMISDWKTSEHYQNSPESLIVISASGFGEAGRIREWMKKDLGNPNSTFVFVGYSSPESTSGQIKSKNKYISVDGEKVSNKASVINLLSFTSHMQHEDMLKYYSNMNLREIYLVHGEMTNRLKFAELLEQEYRKKNKTTKVYIGTRDLEVTI